MYCTKCRSTHVITKDIEKTTDILGNIWTVECKSCGKSVSVYENVYMEWLLNDMNYEKIVERVRETIKAVQDGELPETSLIFVVGSIVNPGIPTVEDIKWARSEIEKRKIND